MELHPGVFHSAVLAFSEHVGEQREIGYFPQNPVQGERAIWRERQEVEAPN